MPETNAIQLWFRVGTGAGPTYQATLYDYVSDLASATAAVSVVLTGDSGGEALGTDTGEGCSGVLFLGDPSNAALYTVLNWTQSYFSSTAALTRNTGAGGWKAVTAVTSARFMMASDDLTSGYISLYGIKNS